MGAIEAVIRLKRRLSASALRITTPPPSGHSGSAANCPAPDHTTVDIRIAAGGEMPAGPVLAPKMAPRMKVLGRNVSAATKPAVTRRDTPGIGCSGYGLIRPWRTGMRARRGQRLRGEANLGLCRRRRGGCVVTVRTGEVDGGEAQL